MLRVSRSSGRLLATAAVLGVAALLVAWQWRQYLLNPWTRDAQVVSRLVPVAAPAGGQVSAVYVRDSQLVRAGERLAELDPAPAGLALRLAEARLDQARALARLAQDSAERPPAGGVTAPASAVTAAQSAVRVAEAEVEQARQTLAGARLIAPVTGYVASLIAGAGTRLTAGQPLLVLIERDAFRVEAFFRETAIRRIRPGMAARVTLAGYPEVRLAGRVESVGFGIARPDGSEGPPAEGRLPVVSPTFEWIRLAQRLPVRIRLLEVPPEVTLRVGFSATVLVLANGPEALEARR